MDLYHLHRPAPPQQAAPAKAPYAAEDHRVAEHWKGETEKMDRIARDALAKLEKKSAAKSALKAQLVAASKEIEAWRERYNELARSQQELKPLESVARDLQARLRASEDELARLKPLNNTYISELARLKPLESVARDLQARLRASEDERPAVEEKLRVGGQAFRELKLLKPAFEAQAVKLAAAQKLELDVIAGKEKLRAATQDASAKAARLATCTDMLMRAEQVLKTCSQVHSASEDGAPLAEALAETTENMALFLQALQK